MTMSAPDVTSGNLPLSSAWDSATGSRTALLLLAVLVWGIVIPVEFALGLS
jgi:hypothetical protein